MKELIKKQLLSIEQEFDLKILFACESGSRGWGLPSPDSDYDVRFIYTRSVQQYLSVSPQAETINLPLNDVLDIQGWDLRKALKLICKSNTTPFEWLQSPVIYKATDDFQESLWSLCSNYYSQRANSLHYLGIARSTMSSFFEKGNISIKKFFYILRPLLAAKWCIENNDTAPMTINALADLLPADLRRQTDDLIHLKATVPEGYEIQTSSRFLQYINDQYEQCSLAATGLKRNSFSTTPLDDFFLKTISTYDDQRP